MVTGSVDLVIGLPVFSIINLYFKGLRTTLWNLQMSMLEKTYTYTETQTHLTHISIIFKGKPKIRNKSETKEQQSGFTRKHILLK